jgi:hypothetical protein
MSVPPPPTIQQAWQKFSALSAQAGSVARSYRSDAKDPSGFYDDFLKHEQQFLQSEPPKFCQLIDRLLPDGGLIEIMQKVNIFKSGNHNHKHLYFMGRLGVGDDTIYIFYCHDDETLFTTRKNKNDIVLHEIGITYSVLGFHYNSRKTPAVKEIINTPSTINFNDDKRFLNITELNLLNAKANEWNPPHLPNYGKDIYEGFIEKNKRDELFHYNFTRFFEVRYFNFRPNKNPFIVAKATYDGQKVEHFNKLTLLNAMEKHVGAKFPPLMLCYMERLELAMSALDSVDLNELGLPQADLIQAQAALAAREANQVALAR